MRPPDLHRCTVLPSHVILNHMRPCRVTSSSQLAFVLPVDILLRMRRTAVVVLTSAAISLTPGLASPARAATAAATFRQDPKPAVIFDRSYANRPDPIWESLGMSSDEQPVASQPSHASVGERLNVPRNSLKGATKRILLVDEVRILMRLLVALTVGGIIGVERRAAKSFAGVRTFSLVSLGAAIFMSTALVAFPNADPARVAAAISSSVGFLGAGVMSKNSQHSRGLTTASSVWLAAALGIAAASGLFILSYTGAILTVLIARYARFDSSLHLIHPSDIGDDIHDDIRVERDNLGFLLNPLQQSKSADRIKSHGQSGAGALSNGQLEATLRGKNDLLWETLGEDNAIVDASTKAKEGGEESSSRFVDNGSAGRVEK